MRFYIFLNFFQYIRFSSFRNILPNLLLKCSLTVRQWVIIVLRWCTIILILYEVLSTYCDNAACAQYDNSAWCNAPTGVVCHIPHVTTSNTLYFIGQSTYNLQDHLHTTHVCMLDTTSVNARTKKMVHWSVWLMVRMHSCGWWWVVKDDYYGRRILSLLLWSSFEATKH